MGFRHVYLHGRNLLCKIFRLNIRKAYNIKDYKTKQHSLLHQKGDFITKGNGGHFSSGSMQHANRTLLTRKKSAGKESASRILAP